MKHHVILLRETSILERTYTIMEFNLSDDDVIPIPGLADELKKCSHKDILGALLVKKGFVERSSWILQPDENGKEVKISIGQASLIELALAETAIVSMFFFDQFGLPKTQVVYDLRIDEG